MLDSSSVGSTDSPKESMTDIKVIKLYESEKNLVILEMSSDVTEKELEGFADAARDVSERLNEFMEGPDTVMVLVVSSDTKIKVMKVETSDANSDVVS